MAQVPKPHSAPPPTPPQPPADATANAVPIQSDLPPPPFNPSRMIGIIKRKALIKKLAAVYHAECLAYCQQLLDLQNNSQEPFVDLKTPPDDSRKEPMRPPSKRLKKTR